MGLRPFREAAVADHRDFPGHPVATSCGRLDAWLVGPLGDKTYAFPFSTGLCIGATT